MRNFTTISALTNETSESPNVSIVVAGDFNSVKNGFQEKIITNNRRLKLVVKKPTRGTGILDLIFSNACTLYKEPEVLARLVVLTTA